MKNKTFLFISLLILSVSFKAQDARFNLFNATPLHFNPSFAGSLEQNRVSASLRNSFAGISGDNTTQVFSYDQLVHKAKGGLGLLISNDNFREFSSFNAAIIYAPKLVLNDKIMISPSIKLGYGRKGVEVDNLTFGDMIDPRRGFVYNTNELILNDKVTYFDLSAGIILNTKNIIFGYAIDHINKPNESFFENEQALLPIKQTFMLGANLKFSKNSPFSISPNLVYLRQDNFNHLSTIIRLKFKNIAIGSGYNSGEAIPLMASYEFKRFRLSYNYEIAHNLLTNSRSGAHGISIRYLFNWKKQVKNNNGINE